MIDITVIAILSVIAIGAWIFAIYVRKDLRKKGLL